MMLSDRVTLPKTDLGVSPLCLGGNRLGGDLDQDASFALLDAFVEAGGNFIDTAHVYADWLPGVERSCSEKTIGRWLAARGGLPSVVVATKGGHPPLADSARKRLDEASLRQDAGEAADNLGRSAVDLFYLHRDDPSRPVGDILGALEALRREGLIRHYAASNWSAARLAEAAAFAKSKGWTGFVANQVEWSLAIRNPGSAPSDLVSMDSGMVAFHHREGIAAIPYSAQAKGYFDKVAAGHLDPPTAGAYDSAANRVTAEHLSTVARSFGATPTQVMLRALVMAPFPTIPVVGCRDARQLGSSIASLGLPLDHAIAARLLALPSEPPA